MPTKDAESNLTFLVACMRHLSDGRINFEEVAKEVEMPTRGAAAKRYERFMKSVGLHQSQLSNMRSPATPATPTTPTSRKAKATPMSTPSGKRKTMESDSHQEDPEDVEVLIKTEVEDDSAAGDSQVQPVKRRKVAAKSPRNAKKVQEDVVKHGTPVPEDSDELEREENLNSVEEE